MPWRTRKKGKGNQKGQHFFVDTKSQQQKKMNLPTLSPKAEKNRILDDIEDKESEREQALYAIDIGTVKLTKEQLEELEKNQDINTPYEIPVEGYVPEGDSFPVNQQPSFFDKLKQRILTKPKKDVT